MCSLLFILFFKEQKKKKNLVGVFFLSFLISSSLLWKIYVLMIIEPVIFHEPFLGLGRNYGCPDPCPPL